MNVSMKFLHISSLSLFLLSTITMEAMAQINQLDPPVMGWSSWNTYRIHINEALIKKQADAMVSQGLKEAGYLYVNVDDGFFGWRDENGKLKECSGWTEIFIYPGYKFKVLDCLITNFHLPESTLIMLVSALAGREHVLAAYEEAVKERYRFFSFGDAMFIE